MSLTDTRHQDALLKGLSERVEDSVAIGALVVVGSFASRTADAVATFAYDVGAHPDSSARDDIVFRGSPLVPPLFMPVTLLGAGYLAAKRGPVGVVATAVMGLVGLGFIGGTTSTSRTISTRRATPVHRSGPRFSWRRSTCRLGSRSRASPFLHSGSVACVLDHAAPSTGPDLAAHSRCHQSNTDQVPVLGLQHQPIPKRSVPVEKKRVGRRHRNALVRRTACLLSDQQQRRRLVETSVHTN